MTNLDVTQAIMPKSDQLNADSLIGGPITIKITNVEVNAGADQPIVIHYEGENGRPWKPSKTSARCLAVIWGANASQWIGMSCELYNDPTVTWGGAAVGGVRVSKIEGIDAPRQLSMTKTRGKKSTITLQPLIVNAKADAEPVVEINVEEAQDEVRNVAESGKDAFRVWWKDNADKREAVKPIMDEIKAIIDQISTEDDQL
jgi:hypothetical protein